MKKLVSLVNVRDLVTSVAASLIILSLMACGGAGMPNILPNIINGTSRVAHLISLPASGHRIAPGNGSKAFLTAALFQAAGPTQSQLAQSYDVRCTVLDILAPGGILPIPGTPEPQQPDTCNQRADTVGQLDPILDGAGGRPTFFDGTLGSLIVTGKTVSNTPFQCRDITHNLAVADNSLTQAYLNVNTHQVFLLNQAVGGPITQVPFVCDNIGSDADPVKFIDVEWVKG
jgi:hypothetical protein